MGSWGYSSAMKAAGANVVGFKSFGSYQGDWWALVEFDGKKGWVNGSYGSCSGCDAFESEFGYSDDSCKSDDHYSFMPDCDDCIAAKAEYDRRMVDFGKRYLGDMMDQGEAIRVASQHLSWDSGAQEVIDFLNRNAW